MNEHKYIGWDAHKKYSLYAELDEQGAVSCYQRVEHDREKVREALARLAVGSRIALEAGGSYYWLVEEMEKAGHQPQLTNPLEARRRMGDRKKTDKMDAKMLAQLLRAELLPVVWIPPGPLRDQREMLRLRMFLVHRRTSQKNRVQGMLQQYNLVVAGVKDVFSQEGQRQVLERLKELPEQTRQSMKWQLEMVEELERRIAEIQQRIEAMFEQSAEAKLLDDLPGVAKLLSLVMAYEIGDVNRFASAGHLSSYAGLVPRVNSSGGKTRLQGVSTEINHYLKWAYVEAANAVVAQQRRWQWRYVVQLYQKVTRKKNHAKAVIAVAHHLAESSWWMLKKKEGYREPRMTVCSTQGKRGLPLAELRPLV